MINRNIAQKSQNQTKNVASYAYRLLNIFSALTFVEIVNSE